MTTDNVAFADTNLFIRLFTKDEPKQYAHTQSLFQKANQGECELVLHHLILA